MTTGIRNRIRSAVKPFPRKDIYPTGWGDEMNFDCTSSKTFGHKRHEDKGDSFHIFTPQPSCVASSLFVAGVGFVA
ncbi:MAG: hypothetical protein AAF846_22905 [Chloroflexota bacterium]